VHFVIAAAILAVTALGWQGAVNILKLRLTKDAVPLPAGVRVDDKHRNLTMATKCGTFERVETYGVLDKTKKGLNSGPPDGEVVQSDDVLETLGMGTDASLNWYLSRIYRGTVKDERGHYPQLNLDLTYYTGALDAVPHIPEVCGVAGGYTIVTDGPDTLDIAIPDGPKEWRNFKVNRVLFESRGQRFAQYYVFILNGQPQLSREMVRVLQWDFTKRYCYFGKIQVSPQVSPQEPYSATDTDRKAREFFEQVMPSVLKEFTSSADLEALEAQHKD